MPRDAIVAPEWLKSRFDAKANIVVIEASWASLAEAQDYRAGHVPGAVHVNTDDFENGGPRWRLRPLAELHQVIGAHGIGRDATAVVYGKQTIAAARVWWILAFAGVRDVRILNGGAEAWQRAGYALETGIRQPAAARFNAPARREMLASTEYVHARIAQPDTNLIDVRSKAEFEGQVSGYSYIEAKGRIPGAEFADNADDTAHVYQRAGGTLRDAGEIRALWQSQGLLTAAGTPKGEWIFYCGSGWRSSLAYLYAHALGFPRIRNYSDGWSGWSTIYERAPEVQGSTPGWRQRPTGNPVE